jgi:hypothetical protein
MGIVRWGALGFMGSGVLWVVDGLFDSFGVEVGFISPIVPLVAFLLLGLGIVGLHALQKGSYGLIGEIGYRAVLAGVLIRVLGIIFVVAGSGAFLWLVSPVGPLVMLFGWILYGVATLQARVLPRWCGVLFIVSLPVGMILEIYWDIFFGLSGNMFFGLVLLILSYVLWPLGEGTQVEEPTRRARRRAR